MRLLASWVAKNKDEIKNLMNAYKAKSKDNSSQTFKIEDLFNETSKKFGFKSNKAASKVQESLDAFKNLGSQSWAPTIFLESDNSNKLNKSSDDNLTFIAVEDETLDGESMTAYQIVESEGDDEVLQPVDETLTLEFVGNNDLLVMELVLIDDFDENSGGGSTGGGSSSSTKSLLLNKMKIKDLKEGWPFRSEISIKAYKLENISQNQTYECGLGVAASVNCYTDTGNRIVTLKRKWENDN